MTVFETECVVIGGGASGLSAAAAFLRVGRSVAIVEKAAKLGKKLLVTGAGRCNLGNDNLDYAEYHGDVGLVKAVLSEFNARHGGIRGYMQSFGIYCRADNAGRLYPYSNTAAGVLDGFVCAVDRAELFLSRECRDVTVTRDGLFEITVVGTEGESVIRAKYCVLATGGGVGFAMAERLGHTVIPTRPALCAVTAGIPAALKGVRVCAAVTAANRTEIGEVQFNSGSLSGICVMNLSADVNAGDSIVLDLFPEYSVSEVAEMFRDAARVRGVSDAGALTGLLQYKAAAVLLKRGGSIAGAARLAKRWEFVVTESVADTAQSVAGGVAGYELSPSLMSAAHRNLFITGDLVNVWGDCGGYNLMWAFACGDNAGSMAD